MSWASVGRADRAGMRRFRHLSAAAPVTGAFAPGARRASASPAATGNGEFRFRASRVAATAASRHSGMNAAPRCRGKSKRRIAPAPAGRVPAPKRRVPVAGQGGDRGHLPPPTQRTRTRADDSLTGVDGSNIASFRVTANAAFTQPVLECENHRRRLAPWHGLAVFFASEHRMRPCRAVATRGRWERNACHNKRLRYDANCSRWPPPWYA
mgnify:CR=1 FL=1